MRSIDIHAHLVPQSLWRAIEAGREWYGYRHQPGDGLGMKGADRATHVNGKQWAEPKFLPLFKAAEAMGAVLFFHPQPQHNFLMERTPRDGLFNSLGVILDDAIVVAILIAGGVLEACPDLRVCIAHGGGPPF